MADDLLLEILDFDWNRLFITPNIVSARFSEELGAVGDGEVTLPIDEEAITYLPDPDQTESNEGRWRLYEGSELKFAGVVDNTTKRINADNTFTFGGKQRGIILGNHNVGRRDFNYWRISELFDELLKNNVGRAPIATIHATSSQHQLHPAVNCITGDPVEGNYWAAEVSGSNSITIDLGKQRVIDSIRVIPPWWDQRGYKWNTYISPTDEPGDYVLVGYQNGLVPTPDRGILHTITSSSNNRFVKVDMYASGDSIMRLAQVMVFERIADIGNDTDFLLNWIENDDSGNVTAQGVTARVIEQGAFAGDGVLGNSLVTRLSGNAILTHRFRGTQNAVYLTQGNSGGDCQAQFLVDGVPVTTTTVSGNTYQVKAFEVTGLSSGLHTLSVKQVSGTPQVDYFNGLFKSVYRPVRDDDPSVGYISEAHSPLSWTIAVGGATNNVTSAEKTYSNFATHRTMGSGSEMEYYFTGDMIKIRNLRGPYNAKMQVYIDYVLDQTVDLYNPSYELQATTYTWSGSYGDHVLTARNSGAKNPSSQGYFMDIDTIEGNFEHLVPLRSFYETNLRMLTRLSEVTNSFIRFNNDGTVDLLGQVGESSGTLIREGENEGGNIVNAEIEDDYTETCSAVLALVTGPDDLPLKAFVIDNEAVKRMGLKIRKLENADANDAYDLTRQAWVELQDHKYPQRRYNIQYLEDDVGDIQVGETTFLYSPKTHLDGTESFRVGKMDTAYEKE